MSERVTVPNTDSADPSADGVAPGGSDRTNTDARPGVGGGGGAGGA